jgi:hypothetical protein
MSQTIRPDLNNGSVSSSLLPSTCLAPTSITMVDVTVAANVISNESFANMDLDTDFAMGSRSHDIFDTDNEDTEVDSVFGEELERIGNVPFNASDCMGQ